MLQNPPRFRVPRARRAQQSARAKPDRVAPAIANQRSLGSWLRALTNAHIRTFHFATAAGAVAFGMFAGHAQPPRKRHLLPRGPRSRRL